MQKNRNKIKKTYCNKSDAIEAALAAVLAFLPAFLRPSKKVCLLSSAVC